MSEMIERVARAMMKVTALRPGSDVNASSEMPVLSMDPDFDDLPRDGSEGTADDEITQEAVLRLARAAIEAMREPTEAMLDAARWEDGYNTAKAVWAEMISAALAPHPRIP